jgi:hypothetical protein
MTDWATIKALAAQFVNRRDIVWDTLAPLAAHDISNSLTVQENEGMNPIDLTDDQGLFSGALPTDFARVRSVMWGTRPFVPTDLQTLMALRPRRQYAISGMKIWTAGSATPLNMAYSTREPVPAADSDSSLIMQRYSHIWTVCLAKWAAHRITDYDAEEAHKSAYDEAVMLANGGNDLAIFSAGFGARSDYAPAGG